MKFLEDLLHKQRPLFEKGGKLEKFYYAFEAGETFLFTPPTTNAAKGTQIRDAIDLKRMMMTVVLAMVPCLLFGIWNAGHQHYMAIAQDGTFLDKVLLGSKLVIPIVLVSYTAGGLVEVVFSVLRRHAINEGFLVTGMLIPLIVPVTIPLWQVAVAAIFAVVIAKEVFGGTGFNILNVAMTARAFLYFAYPSEISGEVWTYIGQRGEDVALADGYSGATFLSHAASATWENPLFGATGRLAEATASWYPGLFDFENLFMGVIPGSIGETSTLMVLIGAVILIATKVADWKIIVGAFAGLYLTGLFLNLAFGDVNPYLALPAHYHLVIGGFAFGAVFMATDPVSAAHTEKGKIWYGLLIGVVTVIIRVFNPAYPEGIMLAVLLMNVFAPLIDFQVVNANKKRRLARATV